jgi:hypothetical protein
LKDNKKRIKYRRWLRGLSWGLLFAIIANSWNYWQDAFTLEGAFEWLLLGLCWGLAMEYFLSVKFPDKK